MRDPILAEALSRKGAVKRIAALCGVTPGAVCQWNRVPKRHVETLAGYLGKKPSELRPDIFAMASFSPTTVINPTEQRGAA
ncbi:hypothetical protein MSKU3_1817 [Komagataeibacter oboediens]|nr:hypothetical protein MSKU3_1817 [Komagataeibacter oboediens]